MVSPSSKKKNSFCGGDVVEIKYLNHFEPPTVMPARTNKHHSKKERRNVDNMLVTRKNAQYLANVLIDQGEVPDLQRVVDMLQKINDHMGNPQRVVLCSNCAKKIGVQHCSGCPDTAHTRYCSRECQTMAWPSHKAHCGARAVVDVE